VTATGVSHFVPTLLPLCARGLPARAGTEEVLPDATHTSLAAKRLTGAPTAEGSPKDGPEASLANDAPAWYTWLRMNS
jgi:hypothetical protein